MHYRLELSILSCSARACKAVANLSLFLFGSQKRSFLVFFSSFTAAPSLWFVCCCYFLFSFAFRCLQNELLPVKYVWGITTPSSTQGSKKKKKWGVHRRRAKEKESINRWRGQKGSVEMESRAWERESITDGVACTAASLTNHIEPPDRWGRSRAWIAVREPS